MVALSRLLKLIAYTHLFNHKIQTIQPKCSSHKIDSHYSESFDEIDQIDQEPESIKLYHKHKLTFSSKRNWPLDILSISLEYCHWALPSITPPNVHILLIFISFYNILIALVCKMQKVFIIFLFIVEKYIPIICLDISWLYT